MFFNPFGFSATRNPFRDLERLVEDLHSTFNRTSPWASPKSGEIPINVWSNDDGLMITAEVPGIDPTSITVNVLGDTVTLSGKRAPGVDGATAFTRTIQLPYRVDPERTQARGVDGVLSIALHRPEAERPRTIAVTNA